MKMLLEDWAWRTLIEAVDLLPRLFRNGRIRAAPSTILDFLQYSYGWQIQYEDTDWTDNRLFC